MGQKNNSARRGHYVTTITLAVVAELFASSPVQAGPIWNWLTGANKATAPATCAAPMVAPAVPAVATVPQVAPCGTVGCAGGVCAYAPPPYRAATTTAYAPNAYATTAAYAPAAYPTTVGYPASPTAVYSASPTTVGYAPAVVQPGSYGAYAVGTPGRSVVNSYYAPAAVPVRPTIVAAYPYAAASPAYAPTVVGYAAPAGYAAPRPVQAYYSVGTPVAGTCAHCNAVTSYAPSVVGAAPTAVAPYASAPMGTTAVQQGYPTGNAFSPPYANSGATSLGAPTSCPTCPSPSSSVGPPSGASLGSTVGPYGTGGQYGVGGTGGARPADQAPSIDRGDVPRAKSGMPDEQPEVNTPSESTVPPTPPTDASGASVPMHSTTAVPRPRFPHKEIPDPDQGRDRQGWEFRSVPKLLKSDSDRTAGRDSQAVSGHTAHVSFTDRNGAANTAKGLHVRNPASQPEWDDADWRPVNERR